MIDFAEVRRLADVLRGVEPGPAAVKAVTFAAKEVETRAKQVAPRDRPWLSQKGIRARAGRLDQRGAYATVVTTRDPKGRNVGFYVQYGTVDTPPHELLVEQLPLGGLRVEQALARFLVDPLD